MGIRVFVDGGDPAAPQVDIVVVEGLVIGVKHMDGHVLLAVVEDDARQTLRASQQVMQPAGAGGGVIVVVVDDFTEAVVHREANLSARRTSEVGKQLDHILVGGQENIVQPGRHVLVVVLHLQ